VPKVINDELKLKALRDYLNPGETIRSIAKKYGISYTAMQSYLHEIEDYDLRLDVEAKLLSSPGCNREQIDIWSRAKEKLLLEDS
jgi:transposase-like protein